MKIKLTRTAVDALPLPDKSYTIIRDTELKGFGIRVTAGGDKSYIVERMVNGKNVRSTLGRHGEINTVDARALAQQTLAKMSAGINPVEEKRRRAPIAVPAFKALALDYIKERKHVSGGIKESTAADYVRDLEGPLLTIANLPITEITKPVISDLHKRLSFKGPTSANRAMRFARAVFNFAVDNEDYVGTDGEPLIQFNPVAVLSKRRLWNATRRRHTHLDDETLGLWLQAVLTIDTLRWAPRRVEIVQGWLLLMVCCGYRPGEPPTFTRDDWLPKTGELVVRDPKNKKEFVLPLGWRMQMVAGRLYASAKRYLLPAYTSESPLSDPRSLTDDVIDRSVKFSPHDMRRTFASIVSALSPAPSEYQIKRLLNHTPDKADVTTEYIQHERETLRAIMQRVEDIVFDSITSARPLRFSSN